MERKREMTSRTGVRIVSVALLGALGLTGLAALAPTPEAHGAERQSVSRLWPTITPASKQSAPSQVTAEVAARAPIARLRLLIDGMAVNPTVARYDAAHHRVTYPTASLAPGAHTAHLTTWDSAGYYSWRQWSVTVPAKPWLTVDKAQVQAGVTVRLSGQGFQPGAGVSVSLGGVNTGAGGNYGSAVADASGRFSIPVRLQSYPDGSTLRPGTVVLLAHTGWSSPTAETQKASVQIQVVP